MTSSRARRIRNRLLAVGLGLLLVPVLLEVVPDDPDGFGFGLPTSHSITIELALVADPADRRPRVVRLSASRVRGMSIGNVPEYDNMLQACTIDVDADGVVHLDVGGDGLLTVSCGGLKVEEIVASSDGGQQ